MNSVNSVSSVNSAKFIAPLILWLTMLSLAPALAAGKKTPNAGHDTDQPIAINADSLELRRDKNLAIFSGNVDAQQGDLRLKAQELKVWYRPNDAKSKNAEKSGSDVGGAIKRIDAKGKVFVSTPGETARGDVGVYYVSKKLITLSGNVVLTRGQNVLRGQKLDMNLVSGRSKMMGGGGGRVKGLFVPAQKPKK